MKCGTRLRSLGLEAGAKLVRNGFTASTDNRVRLLSLTLLPGQFHAAGEVRPIRSVLDRIGELRRDGDFQGEGAHRVLGIECRLAIVRR
jgi:hypothetical protein